ncbi:MAG: ribose-5-phosphate isomerase RpiA [Gammaproteobacteria bacterium]|nr:ribose-5-phosphate isomerase RpiA [Gammaproteobacteria bacterium]
MSPNELKQRVAEAAFLQLEQLFQPNWVLGIGTGSTVNCFIDCFTQSSQTHLSTVSSSVQTTDRLKADNIKVVDINDVSEVMVYIDGADEVDPSFALIKGGGGALTREKIVASMSRNFVCIVDESKLVDRLGKFPVPVEVLPLAHHPVATKLGKLGGHPKLRSGMTDNGNCILDVSGLEIDEPDYWERTINDIPGVVTTGIFSLHRPQEIFVATVDGSVDHRVAPKSFRLSP